MIMVNKKNTIINSSLSNYATYENIYASCFICTLKEFYSSVYLSML